MKSSFFKTLVLFIGLLTIDPGLAQIPDDTVYSGDTMIVKVYFKNEKTLNWESYYLDSNLIFDKIYTYYRDSTYAFSLIPPGYKMKEEFYTEEFYPDGTLMSRGIQKRRKPNGYVETFYRDGSLQSQSTYTNGKFNGTVKQFYSNGQLEVSAKYENDLPVGTHSYYHQNGQLWLEIKYEDYRMVWFSKSYDSTGREVDIGTIDPNTMTGYMYFYDYDGQLMSRDYYRKGLLMFSRKAKGYKRKED